MSRTLKEHYPDAAVLIRVEREDLAGYMLEHLHTKTPSRLRQASSHNLANEISQSYVGFNERIYEAVFSAWQWLIKNDFLNEINSHGGFAFTEKGKSIKTIEEFQDYLSKEKATAPQGEAVTSREAMTQGGKLDIFISHSSKDIEIAASLIELLRTALNIPANKIRCTSVDGYRLPAGASTDEQLRQEIYDAKVFLGLITPTSFQSTYVLFELGARWGARLQLAPVLASGANAATLRAPLSGLNALSCDEPAQVHQLVDNVASILKVTPGSAASYQKYVDALIHQSTIQKEKTQNKNRASVQETEASIFSAAEERDFRHISRKLDRDIELLIELYQKKEGETNSSKIGEEVYRTNLLRPIIDYVTEGYPTFRKISLAARLVRSLDEQHPTNRLGVKRGSFCDIKDNIVLELQTYGLAIFAESHGRDPSHNLCKFTEKMYRLKYWLDYNNYPIQDIYFELISPR